MKVCIIVSNFYPNISKLLINGAILKLKKNRISNFQIVSVPGTYEMPVVISNLIDKYDAFIALGCVIKGQTSHFHYLCSSVLSALTNLSTKSKKPIGNGIITALNSSQATQRSGDPKLVLGKNLKKGKGCEAAKAVASILEI